MLTEIPGDVLSVADVAQMKKCEPSTVYEAIRTGRLEAFRFLRSVAVRREDAEEWNPLTDPSAKAKRAVTVREEKKQQRKAA